MQVVIRLQRFGSKKRPFYRIVSAPKSTKRDGKFLDIVGLYHPISPEEKQVRLDEDKIRKWLDQGARPTDTVKNLFTKSGLWKSYFEERNAKQASAQAAKRKARKAARPKAAAAPKTDA